MLTQQNALVKNVVF